MPTQKETFEANVTALNDKLNEKAGTTGQHTIAQMITVANSITPGITPSGNINITSTSQVDVTNYATAQVVDANLVASNIKNGTAILGVTGTYTSDATATEYDILSNKTAYVNGTKITGSVSVFDGTIIVNRRVPTTYSNIYIEHIPPTARGTPDQAKYFLNGATTGTSISGHSQSTHSHITLNNVQTLSIWGYSSDIPDWGINIGATERGSEIASLDNISNGTSIDITSYLQDGCYITIYTKW